MIGEIISILNVNKSFEGKKLFNSFSISIQENDIYAIVGPNGSGKTSLLRLMTGLYKIDEGYIEVKGSYSMLLENDYLYEDKTGFENIKQYGFYFGFKCENYLKYSDLLGISKDLERKVATYSKGMKRKLSLLIVVMMDRDIIFLDELTSGVDPISRMEIRRLITILKEMGKTIIITSHDLSEIEKVADKVTMIKDGKLIFTKDRKEIGSKSLENIFIEAGKENER